MQRAHAERAVGQRFGKPLSSFHEILPEAVFLASSSWGRSRASRQKSLQDGDRRLS